MAPPKPEESFLPDYAEFQEAYNLFGETPDERKKKRPDPNKPFEELPAERSRLGQSSSPFLEKVEQISEKSSRNPEILAMVIGTGLVLLIVVVALITMAGIKNYQQASVYNTQVVFQVTYQSQLVLLPPTWTATQRANQHRNAHCKTNRRSHTNGQLTCTGTSRSCPDGDHSATSFRLTRA